jgi:hypothetical protein
MPVADGSSDPDHRPTSAVRMSPRAADIAAAAWGSFLAACFGALVFFALIDPGRLGEASDSLGQIDRMTGYGVGFFFFWLICAVGAGLTLLLVRTSRRERRPAASGSAGVGDGESQVPLDKPHDQVG